MSPWTSKYINEHLMNTYRNGCLEIWCVGHTLGRNVRRVERLRDDVVCIFEMLIKLTVVTILVSSDNEFMSTWLEKLTKTKLACRRKKQEERGKKGRKKERRKKGRRRTKEKEKKRNKRKQRISEKGETYNTGTATYNTGTAKHIDGLQGAPVLDLYWKI